MVVGGANQTSAPAVTFLLVARYKRDRSLIFSMSRGLLFCRNPRY